MTIAEVMEADALRLRRKGLSWREVGREMGVSASTAWRYGTAAERREPGELPPSETERLRAALANGRMWRLEVAPDLAGQAHVLGIARGDDGRLFVVDLPEESGRVRLLAVLGDEEGEDEARALCHEYAERIANEERPVCRPLRLAELDVGEDERCAA